MQLRIALPFVEFEQKRKIFYCENHLIRFLLGTPKIYSLIYSRDLGFTRYPLKGFRELEPLFHGDDLVKHVMENITNLFSLAEENIQAIESLSIKDIARFLLSYIAGLGYSNKRPRIKTDKSRVELNNAYYYVRNVLKLDYKEPVSVKDYLWLNIEGIEKDDSISFFIVKENRERVSYRVLELLVSSMANMKDYILKVGSE